MSERERRRGGEGRGGEEERRREEGGGRRRGGGGHRQHLGGQAAPLQAVLQVGTLTTFIVILVHMIVLKSISA